MRIIAALVAVAGLAVLALSLRALLRGLGRQAPIQRELVTVKLAPDQRIELPAGPVILNLEGPSFTTAFAGLAYELSDAHGQVLPGRPILFRFKRSGFGTTRLELRRFTLPAPGVHRLRVIGLAATAAPAGARLILTRPVQTLRLVAVILGLVLGGGGVIAGMVLAIAL